MTRGPDARHFSLTPGAETRKGGSPARAPGSVPRGTRPRIRVGRRWALLPSSHSVAPSAARWALPHHAVGTSHLRGLALQVVIWPLSQWGWPLSQWVRGTRSRRAAGGRSPPPDPADHSGADGLAGSASVPPATSSKSCGIEASVCQGREFEGFGCGRVGLPAWRASRGGSTGVGCVLVRGVTSTTGRAGGSLRRHSVGFPSVHPGPLGVRVRRRGAVGR